MGRRAYYPDLVCNSRFLVYALVDPRSDEVRYIGLSTQGLKRPKQHLSPRALAREKSYYKSNWIRSLLKNGIRPQIRVLQECQSAVEVEEAEARLIAQYRAAGARLTNHTDGGIGPFGFKHSAETCEKRRQRMLGSRLSPEAIEKRSAARDGWSPSEETRARMSEAQKGKIRSAETKARMSAAKKAWWAEHREEQTQRLREAGALRRGRAMPEAQRLQMSEARKGIPKSEETRRRMSEAKRAWWAAKKAKGA